MASTVLPNGIIIPEKYSRDWYNDLYHNWQELDNLLGGGTPKDGTLTIQKNGDTVGTFSANQATNETIDIEVPTKTSDLNNDSGFITGVTWNDVADKPSFATVATSGSYNDLSNKPTIPTVNNATLTIQKNGTDVQTFTANQSTNATANITVPTKTSDLTNDSGFITSDNTKIPLAGSNQISGDLIPSTDGTVNLGGSSYQWNNLYAKNYYYNGTEFQSKFVTADTVQTVNGVKTFTAYVGSIGSFTGDEYSSNAKTNLWLMSNRDTKEVSGILFDTYRQNTAQGTGTHILGIGIKENSVRYEGCRWGWYWDNNLNGYTFDFKPTTQGANPALKHNLGTSVDKWATLNGINPGALSLPGTNLINIASSITVLDGTTANTFTPQINGWLLINGTGPANDGFIYAVQGCIGMMSANNTSSNRCAVLIPVVAGVEVSITCKLSTLTWANIAPCQGNV